MNILGVIVNRLNSNTHKEYNIIVTTINSNSNNVRNIQIVMVEDIDSLLLSSPKFTNNNSNVVFTLPDEQINPIKPETQNIIIFANHPDIGVFQQYIPISNLNTNEAVIVEFIIGDVNDTLSLAPLYLYKRWKL